MSVADRTERGDGPASDAVRGSYGLEDPARALALGSGLLLTATYVSVLYHVTTVVSRTTVLLAVVGASLLLATGLARSLRPAQAAALGATLLTLGYLGYLQAVPYGWVLLTNVGRTLGDTTALLTGLSVLRMTEAGLWAIAFAPGPVFLSWYLLVRQRYAAGVAVGGAALGFFVLTNDAGVTVTIAGVASAAATVGFGEIERREGTIGQVETLTLLVAVMIVAGTTVQLVPTGVSQPLVPDREPRTVESGLMSNQDRVDVVGSIRLSPEVRFVVESDAPAYWRSGSYDRYTGGGWVRSGQPSDVEGRLPVPPGDTRLIHQRFTARGEVGVMPAAWRPRDVSGRAGDLARVTAFGGLSPSGALREGDSYEVTSARPRATTTELRAAGTDYPDGIERRFTQLPDGTPDRVTAFTEEVTANASTPYETAAQVEWWLRRNKDYSLDVERPDGPVADRFLFEMESGYCTYFATTMVVMLRSQGVPARFVVGYTSGQRVAEDTWVVRALNSHAWVEVYFPGVGWVQFDPTPGAERDAVRERRVQSARESGRENVDAAGSENGTWTPTPDPGDPGGSPGSTDGTAGTDDGSIDAEATPGPFERPAHITPYPIEADRDDALPSRDLLGLGAVMTLGLAAAARRSGLGSRAYRSARIRWQGPRRDPRRDVERAFERLEHLLGRHHRERRPGETRRAYLQSLDGHLDERAHRVGDLYHRARYGDGVSRPEADEAIALVDELVRERTPVLGRLA